MRPESASRRNSSDSSLPSKQNMILSLKTRSKFHSKTALQLLN